jgi:pentatricopeptide repeat protein
MELVRELDGLPLALATAGAYLDQAPAASFSDYLRLYRASWLKLQQKSPELSTYEDRMLYSTWQISYNQVKERNLQSAYLLQLWAYFDNQDIWLGLLQHNEPDDPEWFRRLTEDELSFNEAIGVLHSHGLIEACTQHGSGGYSLHSCVHAWTIHVLNQPWDDTLARIALSCVASQIYNMGETERWTVSRRFLQHASRCSHFIENSMVKVDGMEWAMHNLGYIFTDYDKLEDAEKMFQLALRGNERAFGLEHEKTLNTKSCLAHVYFKQGMIEDAERMFEQVRQAREKILGPSHVLTLEAILHLANASLALGKLENIEKLAQSVWREHKEVLGSQTTEALRIGFIFARLLSMGGMKSEAEEVYQQLLQGFEKILGSEAVVTYPPALEASESLALLLAEAGRVDEARDLFAHAQHGFGLVFGQSSVDYRRVSAKLARLALDPIDG